MSLQWASYSYAAKALRSLPLYPIETAEGPIKSTVGSQDQPGVDEDNSIKQEVPKIGLAG